MFSFFPLIAPPLPPCPCESGVARVTNGEKVTGGAGGLGFEAARALLEHDVSAVVLFDINTASSRILVTYQGTGGGYSICRPPTSEAQAAAAICIKRPSPLTC